MTSDTVRVEKDGTIAICRLDRPPANAVEIGFVGRMAEVFEEVLMKDDVSAVVLTGAGSFFSGGLDLKIVPAYGPEEQRALIESVNRMITRLYGFPRPLVAAVNGHAVAAGLILILTADYRVGTRAACQIGLTEARVGIPFPAGRRRRSSGGFSTSCSRPTRCCRARWRSPAISQASLPTRTGGSSASSGPGRWRGCR
jgi:enoyl-CoA hydratase/carnithine racemase